MSVGTGISLSLVQKLFYPIKNIDFYFFLKKKVWTVVRPDGKKRPELSGAQKTE
jgi:hypothetical protein